MLLDNAISAYLLLAETERRLAPRTVRAYAAALDRLADYARGRGLERLEHLTPNLVRGAAAAQMARHAGQPGNWSGGEAMAATLIAAARTMVRRLAEEYPELGVPDLGCLKAPKVPERIQPRLEEGEFARLEAALNVRLLRDRVPRFLIARDMAILEVLANTGLRAAECCALDADDVDLLEGTLTVRQGKWGDWRILTVRDPEAPRDGGEVVRALRDYLRYRAHTFGELRTEALWLTPKGHRLSPNGLRLMLRVLCDEAGIPSNRPPHAFRRSYFTEEYQDNPNALPVLIERMGWRSGAMARVYTRGVAVELARRIPLPLASKRWRERARERGTNRPLGRVTIPDTGVPLNRRGGTDRTVGPRTAGNVNRPAPGFPVEVRQGTGRRVQPA